jgi:E3 ubiquitin-protein ligase RNF216
MAFRAGEVIDLISDDEEDAMDFYDPETPSHRGTPNVGRDAIDLTAVEGISGTDVPRTPADTPTLAPSAERLQETECLRIVLGVLPNISVDHVLTLIRERDVSSIVSCQALIGDIFEQGPYPMEDEQAVQRKRKREDDSDSDIDYEKGDHMADLPSYFQEA